LEHQVHQTQGKIIKQNEKIKKKKRNLVLIVLLLVPRCEDLLSRESGWWSLCWSNDFWSLQIRQQQESLLQILHPNVRSFRWYGSR
jgi:hypothetical protein